MKRLLATLLVVQMAMFLCGCLTHKTAETGTGSSQAPVEKIDLPGLAVSLGMSVDEVAESFQNIEFKHTPEQRWQRNGHSLRKKEEIYCDVVHLRPLNNQLLGAYFVFESHRLVEVALTLVSVHNSVKPLVEALNLREIRPDSFEGLDGRIVMQATYGDAEKMTWVISRK